MEAICSSETSVATDRSPMGIDQVSVEAKQLVHFYLTSDHDNVH
jgi:hypothetical protein